MRFFEIHPDKLTESQWESYFENREVIYRESNPRDPLPSRDLRRAYMLNPHPDYNISWWFALNEDDMVVGTGGLWWAKEHVPNYDDVRDPNAEIVWTKIWDSNYTRYRGGITIAGDDLLIFGASRDDSSIPNYQLVRLDSEGTILWEKKGNGVAASYIYDAIVSDDGSIYATGCTQPANFSDIEPLITPCQPFLLKFDSTGNLLWNVTCGYTLPIGWDIGMRVLLDNDGNIFTLSNSGFVSKFSTSGFQYWNVSSRSYVSLGGRDMIIHPDGSLTLYCTQRLSSDELPNLRSSIYLLHLDEDGDFSWDLNYTHEIADGWYEEFETISMVTFTNGTLLVLAPPYRYNEKPLLFSISTDGVLISEKVLDIDQLTPFTGFGSTAFKVITDDQDNFVVSGYIWFQTCMGLWRSSEYVTTSSITTTTSTTITTTQPDTTSILLVIGGSGIVLILLVAVIIRRRS